MANVHLHRTTMLSGMIEAMRAAGSPTGWVVAGAALLGGVAVPGTAGAATFSCNYVGTDSAWATAANWTGCNGSYPNNSGGNTYDATLNNGQTSQLTTPNTAGALTIGSGTLIVHSSGPDSFTAAASNAGQLIVDDYADGQAGSTLAIGGMLTNTNLVQVGNGTQSSASMLTVGGLANTGTVTLNGSPSAGSRLIVNAPAASASTGVVNLTGNALLQYGSGAITSIGSGAQVNENGQQARIAVASAPGSNSALTTLGANAGQLFLYNGATLTTTAGLSNSGYTALDYYNTTGGSSLGIGGTLTNSGTFQVGNNYNSSASAATATGLNNIGGTLNINGSATGQGSLVVSGAAPAASVGIVNLTGNALLQYSGGAITSIGSSAQINENGANARVALASGPGSNSALTTLGANAGQLFLYNGATLTTTTGLSNSGYTALDYYNTTGGSSLGIGGTLTNSGTFQVGNNYNSSASAATATGLNNTGGTLNINGSATGQGSLVVSGAAPAASVGIVNLTGNALLQYGSGAITSIGSGAQINENGQQARIAVASAPGSNSALTTLGANAGQLFLYNGAALTTTTGLSNSGYTALDYYNTTGGSSLGIGGTLTNSGTVQVGNNYNSSASAATATGLNNTGGTLNINGSATGQGSLVVSGAPPAISAGIVNLTGNALLQYGSGAITSIGSGAQINENGANARVALASGPGSNSALTTLGANAGQLFLYNGATLTTTTGLDNSGYTALDYYNTTGGSSLGIGGTLTNSGTVQVGNNYNSSASAATATGLNNTGTVQLDGSATVHGTLTINGAALNSNVVTINTGGALTVTSAPYTQAAGITNVAGALTAPSILVTGGALQGTGTVTGAVRVSGGYAGGGYADANRLGTLIVNGSYSQRAGALVAQLQGTGFGQNSLVAVSGPVTLTGGTLQANTENGLALAAGQSFTVASFTPGSLNGLFGGVSTNGSTGGSGTSQNLGNGLTLGAVYNDHAGTIQLQVAATPASTAVIWTGGTGSFGTAAQWSTAAVPTFFNDVTIGATNSGNATLNQDATVSSLLINSGNTLQYAAGSPQTLTVGQNVTVQGSGSSANLTLGTAGDKLALGGNFANTGTAFTTIGNGASITAQGTVSNNNQILIQGGTLTGASVANAGQIIGYGTVTSTGGGQLSTSTSTSGVQAQGGTLVVSNGVSGSTGKVTALANSVVDLSGATTGNTTGTLMLAGTGAGLKLGAQSITVSSDYSNPTIGNTGNAFNNRLNVSGSGLILAAGNAAQSVSGTGVTNGTGTTPTLAIGNVHTATGGTATFTVDNTGTTGPSIRGAVQNTGITASGLTVTAQNFGPVALGGSSAAQTVTYTPASAGALSGQSFKVVSNFDNIATQTVGLTGAAYDYANPVINTAQPVAFGNVHLGDTVPQQAVSISNAVVSNAAYQEGLNAAVTGTTGAATAAGSVSALAAGGTNASSIKVGLNTATAGAKTGTATLGLVSNGAGTSGLGLTTLTPQTVNVTGSVYNLAQANTIAGLAFGNVHQNAAASQALSVSNVAPTGSFTERLDASFGGTSDPRIQTSGSVTTLAAGATNNTALRVSINTANTGSINGTVTVNLASDGAGTSGLGITTLASQTPGVTATITSSGSVYGLAQASAATPSPVAFGAVRLNTTQSQLLSLTNTAANDGFHEKLDAQIGTATGAATTNAGSFTLLAPQATNGSSLAVGLNTATAGVQTGTATIALQSDGAGTSNLGTTALPSQTVNVSGTVYRLASPTVNTASISLAARVNGTASAAVSITNSSPDAYTEALKASLGTSPGGFSATGAVAGLMAGGTDASSLRVSLNTATSGSFSGNQAVSFASTGAGTTGAADAALAGGTVAVSGQVYQAAAATVTPAVAFGIVHVNQAVTPVALTVTNTATGALTDVLQGSLGSVAGPFSSAGSLGAGVAAGASSSAITVGLNTATAGVFSSNASLSLTSHDGALADLALASQSVGLSATVNNYALAGFGKAGGAGMFTGSGSAFTLDLGTLTQGSGALANLFAGNFASGPADLLSGTFSVLSGGGFGLTGFTGFSGLAAGGTTALSVSFSTSDLGIFREVLDLAGTGSNAGGYSASIDDTLLTLEATVVAATGGGNPVPEPATLALLASGLLATFGLRRRAG